MNNRKIYFPRQAFVKVAHAGSKPSMDFEDALEAMGAEPLGFHRAYFPGNRSLHYRNYMHHKMVMRNMPENGILFLQYPLQYHVDELLDRAKERGNAVVVLIHDINELRGIQECNYNSVLSRADILIAHTPAMRDWLVQRFDNARVVVLGMFDYLQDVLPRPAAYGAMEVAFAGNLGKSEFLNCLSASRSGLRYVLYGIGCPPGLAVRPWVDFRGVVLPEEVPEKISSCGYGLVWDGSTDSTCNGTYGEYLKYNAPYKLSSYIAAGLPVIVWDKMAMAPFVMENGIGIALPSLSGLETELSKITAGEYAAMRTNAKRLQQQVSTGYFARTAIAKALALLAEK